MTEDTNRLGRTKFLDGSVSCPGQTLEGKKDFESFIRTHYSYYAPYITYSDMLHLWDMESEKTIARLPTRDRIAARNRHDEILAKIDFPAALRKMEEDRRIILANKPKENSYQKDLGPREFTLTYSPQWFNDEEARKRMKIAIEKLCRYYDGDIVELRAVGEVGKNGLSHVHCYYELKGGLKITDKNFKRAYPMWNTKKKTGPTGHQGGHHANVKVIADFRGYIEKEVASAWLDIKIDSDNPTNAGQI